MAAVAQPAFGLQAPSADDTMEISSNFGGDMDGDIDIDLDSAGEQMQYDEDDHMIDDAKPDNIQYQEHVDEDVMVDDDAASHTEDRVMQDSPPHSEHDEELLDFSDNEDMPIENTDHVAVEETVLEPQPQDPEPLEQVQSDAAAELLNAGVEPVDHLDLTAQTELYQVQPEQHEPGVSEDSFHQVDENGLEEHIEGDDAQPVVACPGVHAAQSEEFEQNTYDETPLQYLSQHDVAEGAGDPQVYAEGSVEQPTAQANTINEAQEDAADNDTTEPAVVETAQEANPSIPASLHLDTELSQHEAAEDLSTHDTEPHSPTVTGLHPTIVEYDGNEIFLFPSREPASYEQYLLVNENLVTSSLGDLLQACRVVLGESISEDDELVLGVEELDLYVSEDSTPAFSTSFSELLDCYVKLHQHDGNDHPPAFRVTLTTKTRFTNRLTTITQAIAEGKGFSQLAFLQEYNQFEAITELPDPDEDFDDEQYLDVDENHSHVNEQQEQNDTTQEEHVSDGNANELPVQQEASEAAVASGHAEIETKDGDDENAESIDAGEYQLGEYEEGAVGQPEHVDEVDQGNDDTQTEGLQEETQYFDAEGDDLDDTTGVDGQDLQQDPEDGQTNVATEGTTDFDGEDYLLDYSEDDDSLTTTEAVSSNAQLESTRLDDSLTSHVVSAEDFSTEAPSGQVEDVAHEAEEHEENLFDGEADEVYDNTGNDFAASEATAPNEDTHPDKNDAVNHTDLVGSSFEEAQDLEAGESKTSSENTLEGDGSAAPSPALEVTDDAKEDSTTLDNSTGDGDDLDEIDFDDDDYVDEHPSADTNTDAEPAKPSSPSKRSFSELATEGEVDEDGQVMKKVRSS